MMSLDILPYKKLLSSFHLPPPLPSYLPRNIFRGITDDGHRLELTSAVAEIVIEKRRAGSS